MRRVFMILSALSISSVLRATPTISSITGSPQNGGVITINGTGYNSKSPAAPYLFADFATNGNPSSLGVITSWSQTQNVTWGTTAGYGDKGGMIGTAGSGTWTMRVDSQGFNWNDNGQKWHVQRRYRQNYIVPINQIDNQKDFRVWPAGGTGYSNMYWSIQNGRLFVENIGGSIDSGFWSDGLNPQSSSWMYQEIICQASSGLGIKDGTLTYRIDGTQRAAGGIISKSSAAPAAWVAMYPLHIVIANAGSWSSPSWSQSNQAWFDMVYVDNTWQRAIVCDSSTYTVCRKFGVIVPSAWSTTQITGLIDVPNVDFPTGTTAYVHVFDTSNTPTVQGTKIIIGGTVALDNPAPTIASVNPSTGSYLGGTISTVTGTGFLSSITVFIGSQMATSSTLLGPTSAQFTIPVSTPGLSGLDLRVVNVDSQTATLQSTMSYTAAPANQPPYNVSAGTDWAVVLPATITVSGFAADDGLPSGTLTYLWAKKSGPGTIMFTNNTLLTTDVSFSASGTYTLSMTASDGILSTESAVITVVVSDPIIVPAPQGKAFPFVRSY